MKFIIRDLKGEDLICSELKVSVYKELLKSTYGDEPSQMGFVETLYEVFGELTNKPRAYFAELDVYELFRLLVEIRIQSLGKYCTINVTKDDKKCTLDLDLDKVLEDVKTHISTFATSCFEDEHLKIRLGIPKPQRLYEKIQDEYLWFMKSVCIGGKEIEIPDNQSARLLFDKLNPKLSLRLLKFFENLIDTLSKQNLLERYNIQDQKLNYIPSLDSLIWFAKLIFNESLETFYENMFVLSHHGHFNALYVESCTPGEYVFYTKKLIATLSDKEKSSNVDPGSMVNPNQNFINRSVNEEFSDPNLSGESEF